MEDPWNLCKTITGEKAEEYQHDYPSVTKDNMRYFYPKPMHLNEQAVKKFSDIYTYIYIYI